MNTVKKTLTVLGVLLVTQLCSCNKIGSEASQLEQRGSLISDEYITTIKATEINDYFPEAKELEGNISNLPHYDIDLYSIVYTSTFKNKIIKLSGLIAVPKTGVVLSQMQYHHGTMLPYVAPDGEGCLDVPSLYNGKKVTEAKAQYETRLFGNYLASCGYLVSLPDYLGYGVSSEYEHPYSVNNRLAEQSVDMILATQSFCKKKKIKTNGKLYLSGWSEGGAVSVATQKLIETNYKNQISVTANAPLAGFYNTPFYVEQFLTNIPYLTDDWGSKLDVLMWTLYSVNAYSDGTAISNDSIFKYRISNQLDALKNRPSSVLSEVVRTLNKEEINSVLVKFEQNKLSDGWSPKAPIYFNHGTNDSIVYYDNNVELTVANLNKNGGKCYLRKYVGHDHYSLALLYLNKMIEDFKAQ